jgi:hypothetical protein
MSERLWLKCANEDCPDRGKQVLLGKKFSEWKAWEPEEAAKDYEPSLVKRLDEFFAVHSGCFDDFYADVTS